MQFRKKDVIVTTYQIKQELTKHKTRATSEKPAKKTDIW